MESALLIAVPEVEPIVATLREAHDPSAAVGVPAHVTLLYPFVAREDLTPTVSRRVANALSASGIGPFEARFERTARFPAVLYLEPTPRETFGRLITSVVTAFPDHPPYGGAFDTVVPHLTVADDEDADLDAIDTMVRTALPVACEVQEVTLMAEGHNGWEMLEIFPLAGRGPQPRSVSPR